MDVHANHGSIAQTIENSTNNSVGALWQQVDCISVPQAWLDCVCSEPLHEQKESFRVCSNSIFCNDALIINIRSTNLHDARLHIGGIFHSANEGLPCPFTEGGRRDVVPPDIRPTFNQCFRLCESRWGRH